MTVQRCGATVGMLGLLTILFGSAMVMAENSAQSGKVIPLTRTVVEHKQAPLHEHGQSALCRPSPRNLLGLERDTEFSLAKTTLREEKTFKMLALRVEFVPEEPDDPTTTGNGLMDLRDSVAYKDEHGHLFDAAPHDSAYFGKHIEAMHRYWHTVSNGKVSIEGTVYPPNAGEVYRLPHTMAHYGEQDPTIGLTEFYFDAFRAADTTHPDLRFSDYDVYCVFHAGADRQSDWMGNTPNDLFTGYILLGAPIAVDDGEHVILDGMIMPETSIQDNRITVINSVMAHEFGHQLGLVDLYSTETFVTQVGNFSLMDNNAINIGGEVEVDSLPRLLFGSVPVFPDAWSRAFLGFAPIDTVRVDDDAFVTAAELDNTKPQIVLVPITRAEYYLIENRQVNIDQDEITAILQDPVTNVIMGPVDTDRNPSREYDYLLPGSGILIWHVDETVAFDDTLVGDDIPNNYQANTLQWNGDRRFVSLIEADMIVSFRGDQATNFGTKTDMFISPNRRTFSPTTPIPTETNSGAQTGITITVTSGPDLVMDFTVSNDRLLPGFPVWAGIGPYSNPMVVDLEPDGSPEILLSSGNRIFGWRFDGSPIFENERADTIVSMNGDTVLVEAAIAAEIPNLFQGPPVADYIDGIGHLNLVAVDDHDTIHMWRLTDFSGDRYADTVFNVHSVHDIAGPSIVFDRPRSSIKEVAFALPGGGYKTIVGNAKDSLLVSDQGRITGFAGTAREDAFYLRAAQAGTYLLRPADQQAPGVVLSADTVFGPVMADLDRDGGLDIICAGNPGMIWAFDTTLTPLIDYPISVEQEILTEPILADVDGDTYLEIVVIAPNYVYAYNYNGTIEENYPVQIDRHYPAGSPAFPPVFLGSEGGLRGKIILGTDAGEIIWLQPRTFGRPDLTTLPLGPPAAQSPAFAYDQNSQTAAVFGVGGDGFLYGYTIDDTDYDYAIAQRGYDAARHYVYPLDSLPPVSTPEYTVDESSAYAYPNPTSGGEVFIHYELGTAADIAVAIYDVAGNLIDEFTHDGSPATDNTITWNCSDVASGVYYCRLVVDDASNSKVLFCPVAIVR